MARMEEMSTILGRRVDKQVVVFDMAGLSYWPNPVGLRAFKKVLHIDSTFYPETLGTHFIINAPVSPIAPHPDPHACMRTRTWSALLSTYRCKCAVINVHTM